MIQLELHPRHFENTKYTDCDNCAIAKALKEKFPNIDIDEYAVGGGGFIGREDHEPEVWFGNNQFDKLKAEFDAGRTEPYILTYPTLTIKL